MLQGYLIDNTFFNTIFINNTYLPPLFDLMLLIFYSINFLVSLYKLKAQFHFIN